ncbi:transposase [Hazenella sp. IB182353]|uniref:transposase n=1 Tax=Polycladospora coralii TaxID=2771432 RepID=UPI001746C637|nr:transposase [Polycladospora coralii]
MGSGIKPTDVRFRIISFVDNRGKIIRVITNLINLTPKEIADLYRMRWSVEIFFRWIKQNLNVTRLFGATPNAVYGQMYAALITYFIGQWLYLHCKSNHQFEKLNRIIFLFVLQHGTLPTSWIVSVYNALRYYNAEESLSPIFG